MVEGKDAAIGREPTIEEIATAAGVTGGGPALARAVEKGSALSGCGDEHVLAVIALVEGWRAKAKRSIHVTEVQG